MACFIIAILLDLKPNNFPTGSSSDLIVKGSEKTGPKNLKYSVPLRAPVHTIKHFKNLEYLARCSSVHL